MSLPRGPAPAARSTPAPARQTGIREHNLSLVLERVLCAATPISRASVAAETGLTRATVSALVDELIGAALITEVGQARSGVAGRPAIGLTGHPHGPVALGLEINVDHLSICAVGLGGEICYEATVRSDQRGVTPRQTLRRAATLATEATRTLTGASRPTIGAALAVPGLVQGQVVRVAPNLGWHDVTVPAEIAGIPLHVDNEATLAAQGELAAGGSGDSFVYVSGDIGIGAGIVLDGAVMRGGRGFAGEIGHVAVRPDGPLCPCGAYGCLEQYAGQEAILAGALTGRGSIADVLAGAEAGDGRVIACLDRAGTALGVVLAGAVNVLDISDVVLGGIFASLSAWLAPAIQRELDTRVLAADWSLPRVRASVLGGQTAVRGAADAALNAVRHHPARFVAARS